jgi:hypothetical protein
MEYLVVHNVALADRAQAAFGDPRTIGPKLFDLARAKSPIYGRVTLSASSQNALIFQQMYFEIFQPGQVTSTIRGQIEKKYEYYAYLSGSQLVPPITTSAVGCAAITVNPNKVINYEIHHHVAKPSAVVLSAGDVGQVTPLDTVLAEFTYVMLCALVHINQPINPISISISIRWLH